MNFRKTMYERTDFVMPEQKTIHYTEWLDDKEVFGACHDCRKNGDVHFGVLMKRRIFEPDGQVITEYKVICKGCGKQTNAHRSKLLTTKEWEGKNEPEDTLRYRSRIPNIALNERQKI